MLYEASINNSIHPCLKGKKANFIRVRNEIGRNIWLTEAELKEKGYTGVKITGCPYRLERPRGRRLD